jgi:hypothetical protein
MKFDLKHIVFTVLACTLIILPMTGCGGSGGTTVVTDDADAEALAEYDRLIEEGDAEADDDGSE